MKKEHYIIVSYLIIVGSFVFTFVFRSTSVIAPISKVFVTAENLSDTYVNENILTSTGEEKSDETSYTFNNVVKPIPPMAARTVPNYKLESVLGSSTGEAKKIIVDLAKQRVYAYEGDRLVLNFLVSTGKWGATPTGSYRIWYKVRSQTMKGGNPALGTYYYLPNVQFIQYFNKGIGFHSTYWHNNYGSPMSHGCVNMTLTDSETLYHWATPSMPTGIKIFRSSTDNPGTSVEVVASWKG